MGGVLGVTQRLLTVCAQRQAGYALDTRGMTRRVRCRGVCPCASQARAVIGSHDVKRCSRVAALAPCSALRPLSTQENMAWLDACLLAISRMT